MTDERSRADLTGLLFKLRGLPGGSVLYDTAEIEVITTDDGTPSLAMPLVSGDTFIITPEPNSPGYYAILYSNHSVQKVAGMVRGEDLFGTLTRRICPW
jgi:hypothetical protein